MQRCNWVTLGLTIVLLASDLPPVTFAGSGPVISLPVAGVKPRSGLSLTLDCEGVDGNGYRPIRIEVRPLNGKPLPDDRQLRLTIIPQSYYSQHSPRVSQIIELPEGSSLVKASIPIPQLGLWHSVSIETRENGDLLRDLSQQNMGWTTTNSWDWTEARPAFLIIDSDVPPKATREAQVNALRYQGIEPGPTHNLPDFRNLVWLFPDPNRGGSPGMAISANKLSDTALLAQLPDQSRLCLLPPAELPERWIELSQYDVAVVSLTDLKAMARWQPPQLRALAEWAAGGPLLVVYGVGDDFAGLAEVEKLLGLPRLAENPPVPPNFRGWVPADNQQHRAQLIGQYDDIEPQYGGYPQAKMSRKPEQLDGEEPGIGTLPAPASPPFATRPMGLGRVVAIAADNPFPGNDTDWMWVFNSVPRNHWMWYQRNGFSLHRQNDDYWTFLIPGVGEAPVLSFLLLVSLFAVLIGPVNYLFLKRVKRLYLLLLTVPMGALVVTGGLFMYALVTDGLGVRMRARSFTDLDQRTGRAVAWSRQSYYAALAPSRGLKFPEDATVFPLEYKPERNAQTAPQRAVQWDEGQHLQSGFLASRTTTQYVVQRATETKARLVVRISSAGQPPQVTNELGATLHYVLLRDKAGDYWQAERIRQNAEARLASVPLTEAEKRLQQFYREHPLALPHGYDPNIHNSALDWGGRSYMNVDTSNSNPIMAASLLESNLALAGRPTLRLPDKGTYLAVVESSPIVAYGVPSVREEASLHLIRGRW